MGESKAGSTREHDLTAAGIMALHRCLLWVNHFSAAWLLLISLS
jgi:hypothetical protein